MFEIELFNRLTVCKQKLIKTMTNSVQTKKGSYAKLNSLKFRETVSFCVKKEKTPAQSRLKMLS